MRALPLACREFDRFAEGARAAFVNALQRIAASPEHNRHFTHLRNDQLAHANGAAYAARASKELRMLLSRDGKTIVVHRLVRRNDKRFWNSEW